MIVARSGTVLIFAAACLLPGTGTAQQSRALRILLTNDDGFQAKGLSVMKEALVAAGHQVIVTAPTENQSSSGTRITGVPVAADQKPDDTWAIGGSPVDAVSFGLNHVMRNNHPDLVVSGINEGANLGTALVSGTVGAASYASARNLPAIAVAVGTRSAEANAQPVPYPTTVAAYSDAAQLVVRLIASLCSPRCDTAMASGVVINVNYPALPLAEVKDVLVLPAAGQPAGTYEQVGSTWRYQGQAVTCQNSRKTDSEAFSCGYATVAVLNTSRQIEGTRGGAVMDRLKGINLRLR